MLFEMIWKLTCQSIAELQIHETGRRVTHTRTLNKVVRKHWLEWELNCNSNGRLLIVFSTRIFIYFWFRWFLFRCSNEWSLDDWMTSTKSSYDIIPHWVVFKYFKTLCTSLIQYSLLIFSFQNRYIPLESVHARALIYI